MKKLTPFIFLGFLLLALSGSSLYAQKAKVLDLEGTAHLDIQSETAEPIQFGEVEAGTLVRKRMAFSNTYAQDIILRRVVSEPGAFTAGTSNTLRDITVAPGDEVFFYVMTSAQSPGEYDIRNEVIIEVEGRKYRRAVFQLQGFVYGTPEGE